MIDTHAHLLKGKYENTNVKDLIEKELKNTDFIVNVAYDLESSLEISSQVKNHNNLYGAIGIHPSHADKSINIDPKTIMTKLGKLLVNEVAQGTQKIVAIGETGLDFSKEDYNEENQIKWFLENIKLANYFHLPVIVHTRDAWTPTIKIIKENPATNFLLHSWTGTNQNLSELKELENVWFSISGIATFDNAKDIQATLGNIPIDKLMFETDSPFLAPAPNRGKVNYPTNVKDVLKFVANAIMMNVDELESKTDANAKTFFGIKDAKG